MKKVMLSVMVCAAAPAAAFAISTFQSNGVVSVTADKSTYVANDRATLSVYQILTPANDRKLILESTFDGNSIQLIPQGVRWQAAVTPPMASGEHSFLTRAYDLDANTHDNFTAEISALKAERAEVVKQLSNASGPVKEALERRLAEIDLSIIRAANLMRNEFREIGTGLNFLLQVE